MGKFVDLTGKKFGRLTVISRGENQGRSTRWHCRCSCGNKALVRADHLKKGKTKSCGCYSKEAVAERNKTHKHETHGHSSNGKRSGTYHSWQAMKIRTQNPTHAKWKDYGGRGIGMTFRWAKFELFLEDMGKKPAGTSIDRINNNGHYEKSNCKWSTPKEQANNRRPRS
tara:strand:+ start:112 stop:618 length:507 start_codon:yes stop_codon:yes gene_type:complete